MDFACVNFAIVPWSKKTTLNVTNNKPRWNVALIKRGGLTLYSISGLVNGASEEKFVVPNEN